MDMKKKRVICSQAAQSRWMKRDSIEKDQQLQVSSYDQTIERPDSVISNQFKDTYMGTRVKVMDNSSVLAYGRQGIETYESNEISLFEWQTCQLGFDTLF